VQQQKQPGKRQGDVAERPVEGPVEEVGHHLGRHHGGRPDVVHLVERQVGTALGGRVHARDQLGDDVVASGGVEQVDQGGFLPGELLLGIVLVLVALEAPAGAAEQQHAGDGGQ
jgi:hypothetical protein